jgi:hypothetical protein
MASTLNIKEIQLFNLIKTRFGEKEAEEFVSLIKEEIDETIVERQQYISKDISRLREDLFSHFASKEFVEKKVSEVEIKISESKFQIILWAFVFWVTQLGAIFAFLKIFVK